MAFTGLALTTLLALSVRAAPFVAPSTEPVVARSADTFNLIVQNNCSFVKEVGITSVSPTFEMIIDAAGVNIEPGQSHTFTPNYYQQGLRLSGHMEWVNQWQPQALLEFGYSSYKNVEGTAYDLSFMMPVPDPDIGMKVEPIDNGQGSSTCETKTCWPWNCPPSQGWTNPDQSDIGNPADTVCYQGKSDYRVTYCPSY